MLTAELPLTAATPPQLLHPAPNQCHSTTRRSSALLPQEERTPSAQKRVPFHCPCNDVKWSRITPKS